MLQSDNVREKLILFAEEPRIRACLKASILLDSVFSIFYLILIFQTWINELEFFMSSI